MANCVNKVTLLGNLGNDPEIRRTKDGKPVANFSIATSESWKDRTSGERRERTEWHRLVIFGDGLMHVVEQLHKGSRVYLEGQLQTRKWQDKEGNERQNTEVVLQGFGAVLKSLDTPRSGGGGKRPSSGESRDF